MRRHEINLAFENLEPKILLAGNVTVEESGACLKLTGDGEKNQVVVERIDADTVSIRGGDTTVNGAAGAQQFDLGKGNVKLNFKQGGNDLVNFVGGGGGADLELNQVKGRFGNGNDDVIFSSANTTKQVDLKMGDGRNSVQAANSSLNGKVKIQTGQDNDEIRVGGSGLQTLGKTRIATGAGQDLVDISRFGTAGFIQQLTVDFGDGDDELIASENEIFGEANVDGGDGDDTSSGTGNTFAPGSPLVTSVENRAGQW